MSYKSLLNHTQNTGNCLTYDDVFLTPQYSDIRSRSNVDLSCEIAGLNLDVPIIASPMDTVTGPEMIKELATVATGVLHRYNTIEEQAEMVKDLTGARMLRYGFVAIGATGDYMKRASVLYELGCRRFCIDVAHGDHIFVEVALEQLREKFGEDVHLMAGNVATGVSAKHLVDWGADSIRVGVGGGSVCSTRVRTGHGLPNITSIISCHEYLIQTGDRDKVKLIADGGIRTSGDIVKALGVGADLVMLGSLLAGTDKTPGEVITLQEDGLAKKYKKYRGMASSEAQEDWRGKVNVAEGVATKVPYKGSTIDLVNSLKRGVQSGLSYSGARNIASFKEKCEFGVQTGSSIRESQPHILG